MKRILSLTALLWAGACSFDGSGLGPLDGDIVINDADPGAPDAGPDAPPGTPDATPAADARPDAAPIDGDSDGIADSVDNCPDDSNTDQHDEDLDGVGDVCDNCPTVANPNQQDNGESPEAADGVGDACDPRPDAPGDSILFFDSFKGALGADWKVGDGPVDWGTSADGLIVPSTTGGGHLLYWDGQTADRVLIETTASVTTLGGGTQGIGVAAGFVDLGTVGSVGTGYICYQFTSDPNGGADPPPTNDVLVARLDDDAINTVQSDTTDDVLTALVPYRYRFFYDSAQPSQRCALEVTDTPPQNYSVTATDATYTGGYPGLRTFGVTARFENFIVYQVGP